MKPRSGVLVNALPGGYAYDQAPPTLEQLHSFATLCYQVGMNFPSPCYWFYFFYGFRSHWRKH